MMAKAKTVIDSLMEMREKRRANPPTWQCSRPTCCGRIARALMGKPDAKFPKAVTNCLDCGFPREV